MSKIASIALKLLRLKSGHTIWDTRYIPYIKGVSERIKRILSGANIQTAFKPMLTLANVFRKQMDRPAETQVKGIVYKFKCKSCDFTYVGESKRSWRSRWAEHAQPGTRRKIESSIKEHAETTGHDVQSDDALILEKRCYELS